MAIAAKLEKLDHPIVFALSITLVVVGMIAVMSWVFNSFGWTGPLQVVKGGIIPTGSNGAAPQ